MPTFLRSLLETKAAPKNAVARAVSNSRGGYFTGVVPNMQRWDMDQALQQAYERVIWVYRCVDAIASNSSGVPMILREYSDVEGKQVEDPDLDRLFNRRPNIYETAQQFRYRVASQALLSRRGVFIEVVRNRAGRPIELHILPNTATTPIPDAKTFVSGYEVNTLTQGLVTLTPEQVIWLRIKPHPTDVYAQMTPLVAAGIAADTDFLARLYNRNFLANDGRPGMLVAVQGQLMPEDAEELRRRFSGGPQSAGQTTVIEADGISATDMSSNPRDVQWQEAVRGSKEDILLAFGVPESVLGNASGRTFDNADAEFEIFWQVTMMPFMDAMAAAYDGLTIGGIDDDLLVAHDYGTVEVLKRAERRREEKAMAEYEAGTMTIDEYLKVVGREPFGVAGTKVLWVPQGKVPIGRDDATTEEAASLMPVGMAQPADPAEEAMKGAQQGAQLGGIQAMNALSARAWQLAGKSRKAGRQSPPLEQSKVDEAPETKDVHQVIEVKAVPHPYETARIKVEAEIEGLLSAWSRRQHRTVVERISGVKARKNTRHWEGEPGTKALDALYVVNPEQWADDLVESLSDLMRAIAEKEALKAARQMEKSGILQRLIDKGLAFANGRTALDKLIGASGLSRRAALEYPVSVTEDLIRESALRQSQKVVDRITEMDAAGASIEDIKKEVTKMIGSRSSWRKGLATHAATSIMEGGRNIVYSKADDYAVKVWHTMQDERVRPSHRAAEGQTRGSKQPFNLRSADPKTGRMKMHKLAYPGDPTAPIHETANCRCWVELEPSL